MKARATFQRRAPWCALLLGVTLAVVACDEIRSDEIRCEEAVSRLSDCCTGIETRGLDCDSAHGVSPVVPESVAACIVDKSCGDLASSCVVVHDFALQPFVLRDPGAKLSLPGVCP